MLFKRYWSLLVLLCLVVLNWPGIIVPVAALDANPFAAGNQVVIQSAQPVTLYSAPDANSAKIIDLPNGTALRLVSGPLNKQSNMWWRVRGQGLEGYILASLDAGKTQNLIQTNGKLLAQHITDLTAAIGKQAADSYLQRGIVYMSVADFGDAIADFNQIISQQPALAYYYLGRVYTEKKAYNDAIAAYTSAIKIDAQNPV